MQRRFTELRGQIVRHGRSREHTESPQMGHRCSREASTPCGRSFKQGQYLAGKKLKTPSGAVQVSMFPQRLYVWLEFGLTIKKYYLNIGMSAFIWKVATKLFFGQVATRKLMKKLLLEFGLPSEEETFSVWQIQREDRAPINFQSVSEWFIC